MKSNHLKGILESLLFAAGDGGLSLKQIMQVMEIGQYEALETIASLQQSYEENEDRGIMLVELAGTYQLATKKSHSQYLKKLATTPGVSTLSQAALETLAIISYKQPITRTEIEEVRGVKTERPLQTLMAKGLIKEVGRASGTGRAILYGTTKEFLDYFCLNDISELPDLFENEEEFLDQGEADLFFDRFQDDNDT